MKIDAITVNACCTLLGALVGYVVFFNNAKKAAKTNGIIDGSLASDLGYLKKGIEEINAKLSKQDERYMELTERITKVEESAKQAHLRITELKN